MKGVLLDIDGTLLDSNDAHARAWLEALEGIGLSLPYDLVRRRIGEGGDKLLWELAGIDEQSAQGTWIRERRIEILRSRYVPDLAPTRGARALVLRMREAGLRLVVASSASAEELDMLLVAAGVADLLDARVSSSDAGASKPDPDVVEAAIRRSGLSARDVVLLGDTPYDLEAARRAGTGAIALRSGGWKDDALRGALATYDDPADLLAHWDDSPFVAPVPPRARETVNEYECELF